MNNEQRISFNRLVNFLGDIETILTAVATLDSENKELKTKNMELTVKITALESELASRGGTITGKKIG